MKTPREVLLGRHRSAEPELDRIREHIVDRIRGSDGADGFARKLWREMFWPVRHAWLGLGAAWMVVLALNLATEGDGAPGVNSPGPMAPDSVIALQRQEWLMAQSAEDDGAAPPPAKPIERRPRSEAAAEQRIV
ncbi:MAG: hypothetical protein ABSG59_20820 [Verrucomicrobiota bacterium]|jgi:hypothetical protein